jgi:hypothetical protein
MKKFQQTKLDLYYVVIENNCHRVGSRRYSEIIPVEEGNSPPTIGEIISESPCHILDPDQSCDYCNWVEVESITDVVLLDDKKISSLELEKEVEATLKNISYNEVGGIGWNKLSLLKGK